MLKKIGSHLFSVLFFLTQAKAQGDSKEGSEVIPSVAETETSFSSGDGILLFGFLA